MFRLGNIVCYLVLLFTVLALWAGSAPLLWAAIAFGGIFLAVVITDGFLDALRVVWGPARRLDEYFDRLEKKVFVKKLFQIAWIAIPEK